MNGLIRCAHCGKIFARGSVEMEFVDGAFICEDCLEDATFICDHCGERHLACYSVEVETALAIETWCEDCAENDAFYCDHCESNFACDDYSHYDVGGETWCDDCTDRDATMCNECGHFYPNDDITYIESGDYYVCEGCLDDYYYRCDNCGEWVHANDVLDMGNGYYYCCADCAENAGYTYCDNCCEWVADDDYDSEAGMCYECARERIEEFRNDEDEGTNRVGLGADDTMARSNNARVRGYHCAPPLEFWGARNPTWGGRNHHKGIELEVDAPHNSSFRLQRALNEIDALAGEHLFFEHDGSLREGFEIITHPHTKEAFYALPWQEILKACSSNGFSSHDIGTCGLHIHYSREVFGADEETQADNIAKLMQFFELYYDEIVKVSRRTAEQLRWATKYDIKGKKLLKDISKRKMRDHYKAVNVGNEHTVEIRIMRGTLNLKSFLACNDFVDTIVRNSCRIGWSDTTDDFEWLVGLKPETKAYLRKRGAFASALVELGDR